MAASTLSLRADADMEERRCSSRRSTIAIQRQGPLGLLDLSAEFRPAHRRWSIGAYARNLTNEDYITGTNAGPLTAIGGRPGDPRQVGVELAIAGDSGPCCGVPSGSCPSAWCVAATERRTARRPARADPELVRRWYAIDVAFGRSLPHGTRAGSRRSRSISSRYRCSRRLHVKPRKRRRSSITCAPLLPASGWT